MARTQGQRIAEWLTTHGWEQDKNSRSTRYKVFFRLEGGGIKPVRRYVGVSSLREGETIEKSIPLPKTKARILAEITK